MNRRRLLVAPTILALGAASPQPRVVIVGAGIVGAAAAWRLAKAGARVTIVDRARPGSGATQAAFAMLIATQEAGGPAISRFYTEAVMEWRAVRRELGNAPAIQWGGTLAWTAPGADAERLRANLERAKEFGAPLQPLKEADFGRLVPGAIPGPFGAGEFSPLQGTLDPVAAHATLLRGAAAHGARIHWPTRVVGFTKRNGAISGVTIDSGSIAADTIVLCAGIDTPNLAELAGGRIRVDVDSGVLAHTSPFRRVLSRVLNGPTGPIKQDPDGEIVTGPDYVPHATTPAKPSQAYGEKLLAAAAEVLPAVSGAQLSRVTLGHAPIPPDGLPTIGFLDAQRRVYAISTMSGITLAPLLARLAAAEIVGGSRLPALTSWRPDRFA